MWIQHLSPLLLLAGSHFIQSDILNEPCGPADGLGLLECDTPVSGDGAGGARRGGAGRAAAGHPAGRPAVRPYLSSDIPRLP